MVLKLIIKHILFLNTQCFAGGKLRVAASLNGFNILVPLNI